MARSLFRRVRPAPVAVAATITLTLLLTGCTGAGNGESDSDAPSFTTGPSASGAPDSGSAPGAGSDNAVPNDSPLMAVYPDDLNASTAETETVRVADQVQALLDPSTILYVDDHPQLVDSTSGTGQYFGVLRIMSLTETTDPVLLAKVIVQQLKAAGWSEASVDSTDGSYFVALVSSSTANEAWIMQLGGDTSAEGNGAITLNLLSPTFS